MMSTANSTPIERYWLCPLYSFVCECESVDLVEGIQIKPASEELQKHIHEQTYHLYGLRNDPSDFDWVAVLPHPVATSSNIFEEFDRASSLLFDLVIALKLRHEGRLIAGPLISAVINNSQWSFGGTTIWAPVSEINFFEEESKYVFRQPDILEVNQLLRNIRQWREAGVLDIIDIALKRFHSAYHGDIEGRIIDQMIAFESLYLSDPQELTYKLALRAAFLLGKRKNKRYAIFENMKKAYGYRSRIVHGDNPPSRDELRAIVPKTEDYLRQSIQRFLLLLSEGKSLKEIRDDLLDQNIIKNGKCLTS